MTRKIIILGGAALAALAAGAALAGKNHNSSRSNISKKPGIALPAAGVGVSLVRRQGYSAEAVTDRAGEAEFRGAPTGNYTLTISPVQTRAGVVDGVEVWGGVPDCRGEGQSAEALVCSLKVTFDGKAQRGDLTVALLTVAPDAPSDTPRGETAAADPAAPQPCAGKKSNQGYVVANGGGALCADEAPETGATGTPQN